MYCNHCGKLMADDANFCSVCGHRVATYPGVQPRPMFRPRADRKIGGVAAGMARYFETDVAIMRVIWAVLIVFTLPLGLLAYIFAWIIIPVKKFL